ncbi:hypothetical protein [Curtobacterium sp. MCSS17_016]|uniref:hypothetical protein n=1 Tax=Curtobacterium sp. MCSS17_016 TaxID=2175644 RepID=UPI000DAA8648|nr:hypothetical protein [Curtobacterium sp. MCSS17_016]WIE81293.1 hypothetical protein DEJ19_018845 [Curtobacterium sp. MCSS17_016]
MRRFFRSDRAATDPILVIAAIAVSLVLLVGGSFTVSALIANGKDHNARQDLATMVTSMRAGFLEQGISSYPGGGTYLRDGTTVYGFSPTAAKTATQLASSLSDTTTATATAMCGTSWTVFVKSGTGSWFWQNSGSAKQQQVPSPWPVSAPSGYPSACYWPSAAIDSTTAAGAGTQATLDTARGTAMTLGVSYAGQTWARIASNDTFTESKMARSFVMDPSTLVQGKEYVADFPVANDGPTDVWVETDWVDALLVYNRIPAGSTGTVRALGVPQAGAVYGSTYRFADLSPQSGVAAGVLFQAPTIRALR